MVNIFVPSVKVSGMEYRLDVLSYLHTGRCDLIISDKGTRHHALTLSKDSTKTDLVARLRVLADNIECDAMFDPPTNPYNSIEENK